MVISQLNKYYLGLFILLALLSSCTLTSKCPDKLTSSSFAIRNWQGSLPKTADLIRYKKDSQFKVVQEVYPHDRISILEAPPADTSNTRKPPRAAMVTVDLRGKTPELALPISSDYKLILDNKIEYRITDIESSNEGRWGCPLKSLKANNHLYVSMTFEESDGEPVKQ